MIRDSARSLANRSLRTWTDNRDARVLSGVGFGLKFNGGHTNTSYIFGRNERPVQSALGDQLQPGDVFYDIGANVGFFTVVGAKLVGASGQVYAFEPVPENAACVRHNAEINGFQQVSVFECAVTDSDGVGELIVAQHDGGATLADVGQPPDPLRVMEVKLVTVDTLIARGELTPPNVVKIDVEGAEINVLRGMQSTIRRHRPVIILELDDGDEASLAQKQQACGTLLLAEGYRLQPLIDSYANGDWLVWHALAIPV